MEYREEPCRGALNRVTGMPFQWSLNPYMGCVHRRTFCYVRAFEHRADRPSDDRYGRTIRVKVNVAAVLARELARARTPLSLITRGPMIVRDVDVLQEASRRAAVDVSIPTLDRDIWRKNEPGTAPPRQRLRALRTLVDAGIKAGVGMVPLLPGGAREAGATYLWCNVLYLQAGTREHFFERLARDWPEELERYRRLYPRAYLDKREAEPIRAEVAKPRARLGIADRRRERLEPAPDPEQLSLTV